MIDEATLNDLNLVNFPKLIVTDEVLCDIEKARGKNNVAVQKERNTKSYSSHSN